MNLPQVWSPSRMECLQQCGWKFGFRYLRGHRSDGTGEGAVFGSAYHTVFAELNRGLVNGSAVPSMDELYGIWFQKLSVDWKKNFDKDKQDTDLMQIEFRMLLKEYLEKVHPSTKPTGVEQMFAGEWQGHQVEFIIDLLEKNRVTDYKCLSRKPRGGKSAMQKKLQYRLYCAVTETSRCRQITLFRNGAKSELLYGSDYEWPYDLKVQIPGVKAEMDAAARMADSGMLGPCDATAWNCSEQWCEHWFRCRGVGASPDFTRREK